KPRCAVAGPVWRATTWRSATSGDPAARSAGACTHARSAREHCLPAGARTTRGSLAPCLYLAAPLAPPRSPPRRQVRCPVDDRSRAELLAEHPVVLAQEGMSSCSISQHVGLGRIAESVRHLCSCSGLPPSCAP